MPLLLSLLRRGLLLLLQLLPLLLRLLCLLRCALLLFLLWQLLLLFNLLRLLCLLELPNKGVPALMLAAEHLAAEAKLLPRGHLLRLATLAKFKAALGTTPASLRPRLIQRVKASYGALDLRWLEEVASWLRRPPGVAQPLTKP